MLVCRDVVLPRKLGEVRDLVSAWQWHSVKFLEVRVPIHHRILLGLQAELISHHFGYHVSPVSCGPIREVLLIRLLQALCLILPGGVRLVMVIKVLRAVLPCGVLLVALWRVVSSLWWRVVEHCGLWLSGRWLVDRNLLHRLDHWLLPLRPLRILLLRDVLRASSRLPGKDQRQG